MLDGLFKSAEEKQRALLEQHFQAGMQHLSDKFYNQAMIEFQKALEIDYEEVYPRLMLELETAIRGGDLEGAMSIGLNVLKQDPTNFSLANKLGNFAREMGNFTQAQNLYKMSIKANKHYEKAYYNLAACSAKVDLYDDGAKNSISQFDDVFEYILPDYAGEPNQIAELLSQLEAVKEQEREQQMGELNEELERKRDIGESMAVESLEHQIKQLKEKSLDVEPEDFYNAIEKLMENDPKNMQDYLYNQGIYALNVKDAVTAKECFSQLSVKNYDYLDLLSAIAIHYEGDLEGAIDRVTRLLGDNEYNRYMNVNLGLMFRKANKRFLSLKYLMKAAFLLEKSGGLYSMKELIKQAESNADQGKHKKALSFYQIAITEVPTVENWMAIAKLETELKKYDEAVEAYRAALKVDPKSAEAKEGLESLHRYYAEKGDALMVDRKFKASCEYYEKSLTILRPISTLQKILGVYKELNLPEKVDKTQHEITKLKEAAKEAKDEVNRQILLAEGKAYMKAKDYFKAIERFESAFRMKVDKNVYLQLVAIYKGLKKRSDLESLMDRWTKMLDHHEKMMRLHKDLERQNSED